jgi:hypothetical protein
VADTFGRLAARVLPSPARGFFLRCAFAVVGVGVRVGAGSDVGFAAGLKYSVMTWLGVCSDLDERTFGRVVFCFRGGAAWRLVSPKTRCDLRRTGSGSGDAHGEGVSGISNLALLSALVSCRVASPCRREGKPAECTRLGITTATATRLLSTGRSTRQEPKSFRRCR